MSDSVQDLEDQYYDLLEEENKLESKSTVNLQEDLQHPNINQLELNEDNVLVEKNPSLSVSHVSLKNPSYPKKQSITQESVSRDQMIYSVNGTQGIKLNRNNHTDNVTCFPAGCMGLLNENSITMKTLSSGRDKDREKLTRQEQKDILQGPEDLSKRSDKLYTITRNPLTGEGYDGVEIHKANIYRKRDGNPLLGKGYRESAQFSHKNPPGGRSKGLW